MGNNDTIIVDEILFILKLAEYPFWRQPIALDRRDTVLYIQQIVDRFSDIDPEELKYEIKGLEHDIEDLHDDIYSLEKENRILERENKILSQKTLSNKTKGDGEDGR